RGAGWGRPWRFRRGRAKDRGGRPPAREGAASGVGSSAMPADGADGERPPGDDRFGRQVRDVLAHLYDPAYLQTHPLARFLRGEPTGRGAGVGEALRQQVLAAIEQLRPTRADESGSVYELLTLRYAEALEPPEVRKRLAIGRSEH